MVDSVLSVGLQGVQNGISITRQAAEDIATATTTAEDGDVTADITTAIVNLNIGEQQVEASAAVIRTADEILGTVIDILT
ncbi:MAG: flagellar biosynthesis protein FlgE [Pseudomonadales bacterium]